MFNAVEIGMINQNEVIIYTKTNPTTIHLSEYDRYELLDDCISITKNDTEIIIPKTQIERIVIKKSK